MSLNDFFAFAAERHSVYLKRQSGAPFPWTDDPVIQKYRFTNVYRELDATTVWFRENVREVFNENGLMTLMAAVVFRLFNRIRTGEAIFSQLNTMGLTAFKHFLNSGDAWVMHDPIINLCGDGPYCTGSYIVNSPNGMNKLNGVLQMIQWVYDERDDVLKVIDSTKRLETTWDRIRQFPHIADFTSYEIVTDLRHTSLLNTAPDIMTWANPGPGAMRGLNRIHGRMLNSKQKKELFIQEMRDVLEASKSMWSPEWPAWEMRDVEHTLCEFDKYTRAKNNEGAPRNRFRNRG